MSTLTAFEMMFGFVIMNALIVAFVYGVAEIIRLRRELNRTKDMVSRNHFNYLKDRLANGDFSKPEYDDLRLYVLNEQLAHGEIDWREYDAEHQRYIH